MVQVPHVITCLAIYQLSAIPPIPYPVSRLRSISSNSVCSSRQASGLSLIQPPFWLARTSRILQLIVSPVRLERVMEIEPTPLRTIINLQVNDLGQLRTSAYERALSQTRRSPARSPARAVSANPTHQPNKRRGAKPCHSELFVLRNTSLISISRERYDPPPQRARPSQRILLSRPAPHDRSATRLPIGYAASTGSVSCALCRSSHSASSTRASDAFFRGQGWANKSRQVTWTLGERSKWSG